RFAAALVHSKIRKACPGLLGRAFFQPCFGSGRFSGTILQRFRRPSASDELLAEERSGLAPASGHHEIGQWLARAGSEFPFTKSFGQGLRITRIADNEG